MDFGVELVIAIALLHPASAWWLDLLWFVRRW
jgi:hypothetical protein